MPPIWVLRRQSYVGYEGCGDVQSRHWEPKHIVHEDHRRLIPRHNAPYTFTSYTPGMTCGDDLYISRTTAMWRAVLGKRAIIKIIVKPIAEVYALAGYWWLFNRVMSGSPGVRCPALIPDAEWRAMSPERQKELKDEYKAAVKDQEAMLYISVRQPYMADIALSCITTPRPGYEAPTLSLDQVRFLAPELGNDVLHYLLKTASRSAGPSWPFTDSSMQGNAKRDVYLGRPRPYPALVRDERTVGALALAPVHRYVLGLADPREHVNIAHLTASNVRELPSMRDPSTGLLFNQVADVRLAADQQEIESEIEVLHNHAHLINSEYHDDWSGDQAVAEYERLWEGEVRRRIAAHGEEIEGLRAAKAALGSVWPWSPEVQGLIQRMPHLAAGDAVSNMPAEGTRAYRRMRGIYTDLHTLMHQRWEIIDLLGPPVPHPFVIRPISTDLPTRLSTSANDAPSDNTSPTTTSGTANIVLAEVPLVTAGVLLEPAALVSPVSSRPGAGGSRNDRSDLVQAFPPGQDYSINDRASGLFARAVIPSPPPGRPPPPPPASPPQTPAPTFAFQFDFSTEESTQTLQPSSGSDVNPLPTPPASGSGLAGFALEASNPTTLSKPQEAALGRSRNERGGTKYLASEVTEPDSDAMAPAATACTSMLSSSDVSSCQDSISLMRRASSSANSNDTPRFASSLSAGECLLPPTSTISSHVLVETTSGDFTSSESSSSDAMGTGRGAPVSASTSNPHTLVASSTRGHRSGRSRILNLNLSNTEINRLAVRHHGLTRYRQSSADAWGEINSTAPRGSTASPGMPDIAEGLIQPEIAGGSTWQLREPSKTQLDSDEDMDPGLASEARSGVTPWKKTRRGPKRRRVTEGSA